METDYADAHARHWEDAELLLKEKRWANADHLYGLSAECGLKQLMLQFGMRFDSDKNRPLEAKDRVHVNGIWVRYEGYRQGKEVATGYELGKENPFEDWDIADRYANQTNFNERRAVIHKTGAAYIRQLIAKAKIGGWIA
jgi:hypothetical protein